MKTKLPNIHCALFQNTRIRDKYSILNCDKSFYSRKPIFYSQYWNKIGFVKIKRMSYFGEKILRSVEPIELSQEFVESMPELNKLQNIK